MTSKAQPSEPEAPGGRPPARSKAAAAARRDELPEVVYLPESSPSWRDWGEMARELWNSRELAWRLFLRDFSVGYRQSALGYVWAVAPILLTVATFSWLQRADVLRTGPVSMPYPLFVLFGTSVWQLFAGALASATDSVAGAGDLISKVKFPREALIFASFGHVAVEFLIRCVLIGGGMAFYGIPPAWTVVLAPVVLAPLCLLALGLGFFFAFANAVVRDVGGVLSIGLMFWMLLTPVVYPLPASGPGALLRWLNPVSPFVSGTRELATQGLVAQPLELAAASAVGLAVFLLGWWVFHHLEPRLAERM